jgi:2-polyprenyl-6-methoxyphenol hydroxylase-like FAD-dependent oxidoreductase
VTRRWCSTAAPQWDYDVLVCGDGVVGCTVLAGLLQSGEAGRLKMGMISESPAPTSAQSRTAIASAPSIMPQGPVYPLSPANVSFLEGLGAWPTALHTASQPLLAVQVKWRVPASYAFGNYPH